MDRAILQRHLAQAERLVRQGDVLIEKQHALIAKLERDGHDTSEARDLLKQFEQVHAMQVAARDRRKAELWVRCFDPSGLLN